MTSSEPPLCANETELSVAAAIGGVGLAYCLEWRVQEEVKAGLLEVVLPAWASTGPPFAMFRVADSRHRGFVS
jgi:DNA-binding transcriptional LysR family regulator